MLWYVSQMAAPISALVRSPAAFFSSRMERPGHILPVVILTLTGVSTLGAQLLLASMSVIGERLTLSYVSTAFQIEIPAITVAGALVSFGHVFLYWVVFAAIFYLLSLPFASAGTFSSVFWLSAWGFVPWALAGLLWLGAMIVSASSVPPPATSAGNAAFVEQVQGTQIVETSLLVDYLATAWSLGLWTVLVRTVRDVRWWQAALAVGPVAAFEIAKVLVF
ncbi:YIP1 family protein [Halodesulfurarchaeum sp. HSR-GB]|uniref:YIP1 family protein n=1 Tax=Halodesulfurarchaeum sp. HSR-GB TaxID=3074077 RepID=UPI0028567097|nr:YIP1 family protein [Halodesulfurarchaeum sp. HSR-GB]MDR5655918.1 YIP1 family protein [Halodesulfurarchaeum sp. HSR-GB]